MKGQRTKVGYGLILATIMLLQITLHTVHVVFSHAPDSPITFSWQDTQVDQASFDCELCAKLLGQAFYLWIFPAMPLGIAVFLFFPGLRNDLLYQQRPLANSFLRGPLIYSLRRSRLLKVLILKFEFQRFVAPYLGKVTITC